MWFMCVSNNQTWGVRTIIQLQQWGDERTPTILSRMSENGPLHMFEKWVDHCKKCTPCEVCKFKKAAMPNSRDALDTEKYEQTLLFEHPLYKTSIWPVQQKNITFHLCRGYRARAWLVQGKIECMPCTGKIWHTHKVCQFHSRDYKVIRGLEF